MELIELVTGVSGNLEDRACVEAGNVLQAVKRVGAYNSVKFDDPVTQAVISQGFGGWVKLCNELKSTEEKWFQKDFVRIYQAYAREGIKHNGHLAGQIETENDGMHLKVHCDAGLDLRPEIYAKIKASDWLLLEFQRETQTLENIFRNLTQEN